MRRVLGAGLAIVAIGSAGCSTITSGTPMADPDQTGISTTTTTTTRSPSRTPSAAPSAPRSPTPATPPPTGLAGTTCGEYLEMDDAAKREVIAAIGADNELVSLNPELWVGMADMMCSFTPKSTLVKDAVVGQGIG